jgi:hypothetical protein
MFLIALDPEEGEVEFTGNIWPPEPSLDAFGVVLTRADRTVICSSDVKPSLPTGQRSLRMCLLACRVCAPSGKHRR